MYRRFIFTVYAPTGVRAVVAADRRAMPLDPSLGPMRKTNERADSPKLGVSFTNSRCESMDLLVFVDGIGYALEGEQPGLGLCEMV